MSTIEIKTTQNVVIEYELASLRERVLALSIDCVLVLVIYIVLFLSLQSALSAGTAGAPAGFSLISALLPAGVFIFYQLFSEVLADGQSWGKRSMGIRVVRLDGRQPGFGDYLLRAVFHIVDTITSAGILAALLISTTSKNQRLGDLTANTTVIRTRNYQRFKPEDILSINTLEDYQPHYPAVKQLSEQDMLLEKNVVTRYQTHRNEAHREVVDELVVRLQEVLHIEETPKDKIGFLKTLIRDYIVLTR